MPILKFTLHKCADEEFYFRLRNIGDEVMLTSRSYSTFRECINDIHCLREHISYTIEDDPNSYKHRLVVKNRGGTVIAKSPFYISGTKLEQDISVIRAVINEAAVEDHSTTVRFFRKINSRI